MKYYVDMLESERGFGQDRWTCDFDTFEEAKSYVDSINRQGQSYSVPDYYIIVEKGPYSLEDCTSDLSELYSMVKYKHPNVSQKMFDAAIQMITEAGYKVVKK